MIAVRNDSKLTPNTVVVELGDSVNFTCESDTPVLWSLDDRQVPSMHIEHEDGNKRHVLIIPEATTSHVGEYSCEGEDFHNRHGFVAHASLELKIKQLQSKREKFHFMPSFVLLNWNVRVDVWGGC